MWMTERADYGSAVRRIREVDHTLDGIIRNLRRSQTLWIAARCITKLALLVTLAAVVGGAVHSQLEKMVEPTIGEFGWLAAAVAAVLIGRSILDPLEARANVRLEELALERMIRAVRRAEEDAWIMASAV
jgi:hypothetical protein